MEILQDRKVKHRYCEQGYIGAKFNVFGQSTEISNISTYKNSHLKVVYTMPCIQ
jgi:hypothetical protein